MKYLIVLLGLVLAACGTRKTAVTTSTNTVQTSAASTELSVRQVAVTRMFGDTLRGTGFVPYVGLTKLDTTARKISGESRGVKVDITLRPRYSSDGSYTGQDVDFSAVSKSVSENTTHTQLELHATKRDSIHTKVDTISKTTTKPWWLLPGWIKALAALVALLFFVAFFDKIFNFFKQWVR